MDWVNPIISFSAFLGIFMALLIGFQKVSSERRNRFYALIVALLSLQILKNVGSTPPHPAIYLAMQGSCLFIGPTVYLYVRSMLSEDMKTVKIWPHYRLGIIYILAIVAVVMLLKSSPGITQYIRPPLAVSLGYTIMFAQIYHVLWYFQRTLIRLNWHQADAENNRDRLRMKWMKSAVWLMAGVIVLLIVPFLFITALGEVNLLFYLKQGFLLAISFAINYSAVQSFNKPEVVLTILAPASANHAEWPSEWQQLDHAIKGLMSTEKPYLNGDMRLNDLAGKLKVTAPVLSQFLNQKHGKHYSDFMNEYRIAEAKRLLCEAPDPFDSIYGIALESGFNSKATFNRVFKQKTGLSPSEYRKQKAIDRATS